MGRVYGENRPISNIRIPRSSLRISGTSIANPENDIQAIRERVLNRIDASTNRISEEIVMLARSRQRSFARLALFNRIHNNRLNLSPLSSSSSSSPSSPPSPHLNIYHPEPFLPRSRFLFTATPTTEEEDQQQQQQLTPQLPQPPQQHIPMRRLHLIPPTHQLRRRSIVLPSSEDDQEFRIPETTPETDISLAISPFVVSIIEKLKSERIINEVSCLSFFDPSFEFVGILIKFFCKQITNKSFESHHSIQQFLISLPSSNEIKTRIYMKMKNIREQVVIKLILLMREYFYVQCDSPNFEILRCEIYPILLEFHRTCDTELIQSIDKYIKSSIQNNWNGFVFFNEIEEYINYYDSKLTKMYNLCGGSLNSSFLC